MRFSIGSPPEHVIAALDTSSDLAWMQCRPCNKCITQRLPLFDPEFSNTYRDARCFTLTCDAFAPSSVCDKRGEKCLYSVHYQDGSYSHGVVATELFSFTSSATGRALFFNKIIFGCGHNNYFKVNGTTSGIVEMAGGRSSLVRKLGYNKFAYCLMPWRDHNKSTPLSARGAYYFLMLKAISVGNKRLEFHNPYLISGGNIIIDPGSLSTYLPVNFYEELEVAIEKSIAARVVHDFGDWRMCYSSRFVMPKITVHFNGADVEWKFENVFVRTSVDYMCLVVEPLQDLHVYGSATQANYIVGYDLGKRTVSFKQAQCGR